MATAQYIARNVAKEVGAPKPEFGFLPPPLPGFTIRLDPVPDLPKTPMWGSRMRSSSSSIELGTKKLHQDRNRKRRSGTTTSPAQPHREADSSNGDRQVLPQPRHSRRRKRRRNEHPIGGATLAAAAAIAVATSSVAADSLRRFLGRLRKSKRKRDLNMAAQRVTADVPESVQVYTGKDRLSSLPVEVLFNIMDCMTAPALVYSLGPVSSRMAHVVDLYMRQTISKRINRISLPPCSSLPDEVDSGPESAFTLSFEARRPIDTTALTHELQFQGFEICEDAYKPSSSIAITYAKVWNPSEQVKRAAHHLMKTTAVFTFASERGTRDSSGRQEQRRREDVGDGPTPTPAPGWQAWKQPFVPTVPNRHAHRLGPRESSSSITIEREQVEPDPEEDQGEEEYEDEEEHLELRHAVDAYDWAPTSTIGSHGHPSSKSSVKGKASDPNSTAKFPNYRCHLDPLDSFETFLLSLSIKAVGRARNVGGFERRVASGCDRVMRNWFAPPPIPSISAGTQPGSSSLLPSSSNSPGTQTISSEEEDRLKKEADRRLGAFQVLASTFGAVEDCLPRSVVAQVRSRATPPPIRTLEIDGSTCSIEIQPHANVDSILCSHPILRATSGFASISTTPEQSGSASPASPSTSAAANSGAASSAWLFTSPFAYHSSTYATATTTAASTNGTSSSPPNAMNLGSRVELRFHCTKVRIRAARLLAMLHRLEDEMLQGERQEKRFLLRTAVPSPTLGG